MKIPIGVATIIGIIGGVAGVIVPFIAELADTTRPLGVPSGVWLVTGAALAGLVVIGRAAQAVALYLKTGGV